MNRIGLKGVHFKCLHINKEVLWGKKHSYSFCDINTTGCLLKVPVHKCMEYGEKNGRNKSSPSSCKAMISLTTQCCSRTAHKN